MSSAKRAMEQRRAERRGRKRRGGSPREPFATMHADLVLACATTMTGPAFALLLMMNANFTVPAGTEGEAVVPQAEARKAIRAGPGTIVRAFRDLEERGFARLKRAGVSPRTAGGGQREGKAAVYELPHRTHSAPRLDWPARLQGMGVRRPDGKMRRHAERIRADVSELSGNALRLLYAVAAMRRRSDKGVVVDHRPEPLGPARAAEILGIGRASAARALAELVAEGRLLVAGPAHGSVPAAYALARAYQRMERACPQAPRAKPHGSLQGLLS